MIRSTGKKATTNKKESLYIAVDWPERRSHLYRTDPWLNRCFSFSTSVLSWRKVAPSWLPVKALRTISS